MQAYATAAAVPAPQLRLVAPTLEATPLTPDASGVLELLLGQLAELVADRLAARLAAADSDRGDEWLDSRRAAEYLGIGRDSLRRLAAEGSIPTEQAGAGCKLFFRRSDLDGWRRAASGPIESHRSRRHG